MLRRFIPLVLTALLLAPLVLRAQASSELVTRTISLEFLSASDAARLVAPYVQSAKGGAFSAGEGVRAITVRETPARLAEIESIIRRQDRAPVRHAVRLHFRLIRADSSSSHDPRVAGLDSTLHNLLGITGLRLEGEALTQVDEGASFHVGLPKTFSIEGDCTSIEPATDGGARINVSLRRPRGAMVAGQALSETLIGTGLTVPYGRNVILGTTSSDGMVYVLSVEVERIADRR